MGRLRRVATLSLLVAPLLMSPIDGNGATRFCSPTGSGTVCSQAAPCSLGEALGLSRDGDTVYLREGVYTGTTNPFVSLEQDLTLIGRWDGRSGPTVTRVLQADATVLDGQNQRRVVYISRGTCTLDGITVQGGLNSEGAGVAVYSGASATLHEVILRNNVANGGWGGGLQADGGTLRIQNSQIMNNSSIGDGGGVAAAFDSQVPLHNNLFANNSAGMGEPGSPCATSRPP